LQGNYRPVTIDRHNWRMWGSTGDRPSPGAYGLLEDVQQEQAGKMGLQPAPYQSSGWIGARDFTGVKTGNDPALKMFEDAVRRRAEATGRTPQQTLQAYIRGHDHLRRGGAATSRPLAIARKK
jgi:hypothetical protein